MAFKPVPFLLSRAVIARQGVPTEDATRTAAMLGLADLPMTETLVLSMAVGRRQAPPPPVAGLVGVPSAGHEVVEVKVPDVEGISVAAAKAALAADFTVDVTADDDSGIIVDDQAPAAGQHAPKGSPVQLHVAVEQSLGGGV